MKQKKILTIENIEIDGAMLKVVILTLSCVDMKKSDKTMSAWDSSTSLALMLLTMWYLIFHFVLS